MKKLNMFGILGVISIIAMSCSDDNGNGRVIDHVAKIFGSGECQVCAEDSCGGAISACDKNSKCVRYYSCYAACMDEEYDDPCIDECIVGLLGLELTLSLDEQCNEECIGEDDRCGEDCAARLSPDYGRAHGVMACMLDNCHERCDS